MPNLIEISQQLSARKRLSLNDLYQSEFAVEFKKLADTLGITNPRQILYHIVHNCDIVPLCTCHQKRKWHVDKREYRPFCSGKCASKETARIQKEKYLVEHGVAHHSQLPEFKEKIKATSQKKFGVDHYSQTAECKRRVVQTNLQNYGVEHPSQNTEIAQKIQQTNILRYNSSSPLANAEIRLKGKDTVQQRYGVEFAVQNDAVQNKIKQTCLQKYGVRSPLLDAAVQQKIISARRANHYSPETLLKVDDLDWLQKQNQNGKSIGEIAADLNVNSSNLCKKFHKNGLTIHRHSISQLEKQLAEYYQTRNITVEIRNKTVINPKEIDIYFPQHKLGVEVNGTYWHSEEFNKDKFYHLHKTEMASNVGVELLHFWDWEIINSRDKVLDKINNKLGLSQKIFARKLQLVEVTSRQKKMFMEKYHLQKDCPSSINLGLSDGNELYMVATFGRSRFNKQYQWELLRLCSIHGVVIVGGASKLIKHFVNSHMKSNEKLISYCNKQFNSGSVYIKCGFTLQAETAPGYCYVQAGKYAGSRNQWQKHMLKSKLSNFNIALTEHENMANNGYYRLWDCGQKVFELTKP